MARVNPFHPLDICWDWSKICDCTGINGEKNTLAQQTRSSALQPNWCFLAQRTRSFTLSDPTDALDKINMSFCPFCPFSNIVFLDAWLRVIPDNACQVLTLNLKFQLSAYKRTLLDWASEVSWTYKGSPPTPVTRLVLCLILGSNALGF